MLLTDFIRHELRLTGTHVGCEHGVCGACTIHFDGEPVRACVMLAVQADGHSLRTVESLAEDGQLNRLQRAFNECHGLQCGFCTPGFLMTLQPVVDAGEQLSDGEIRDAISGNLCRCTGYQQIVDAVSAALTPAARGPRHQLTSGLQDPRRGRTPVTRSPTPPVCYQATAGLRDCDKPAPSCAKDAIGPSNSSSQTSSCRQQLAESRTSRSAA
ncbi:(2Fe-2S)-binding protein [Klenkia terrae]|uniref:(2Fe-2S)-binding protein n=1 Tax=Klenkia terrae TaxID=1052259 RepID=UPI00361C9F9F